jgi:hypothetical protein
MNGDERDGCDLTHYLAISGKGPASGMFLSARTAKSNGVDWGRPEDTSGVYVVVGSRVSIFIVARMLESNEDHTVL